MNVVRELVVRGLPAEWQNDLKGMVDEVTRQLGGKPLPELNKEEPNGQQDESSGQTPPAEQGAGQGQQREKQGRGKAHNGRESRQASGNQG